MTILQAIKITERVYWVGAIDWELRDFHGYKTSRGSTYNAYLILGEQPILVDTVKADFWSEMLSRVSSIIDPQKIEYIISNHAEMDHSGCLLKMIDLVHPKKVFTSIAGLQALQDHFHCSVDIIAPVKNSEKIQLGNANLTFIETKMIHWPDSMFTYFENEKVLFSQDAFSMHLATEALFTDLTDLSIIRYEAAKYYANILLPYSSQVLNTINSLTAFAIQPKLIAPDHGPVWRGEKNIHFIINLWQRWAKQESYLKAVIVYDTMWQSTAKMATTIADGIMALGIDGMVVEVMPLSGSHRSDIATELLEAGALLVGSPTINQQIFPTVADMICYVKGLKRKNLIGQAFGSYGWGAESIKILQEELKNMSIEAIAEPVKAKYVPTDDILAACRLLGEKIAITLNDRNRNKFLF
jgi:flavorubredoxin